MILPILAYGHEILKTKCRKVTPKDDVKTIIADMRETLESAKGAGLAAPQVGLNLQLFLAGKKAFLNPNIFYNSIEQRISEEGCLSLPKILVEKSRSEIIRIKFWDEDFKKQVLQFDDWMSIVIQHEYDHLKGILITDGLEEQYKEQLENLPTPEYAWKAA